MGAGAMARGGSRLTLAWALSPLVAILAVAVLVSAAGWLDYWGPAPAGRVAGSAGILIVLLLFGAPVAYAVELLVGVPAFYALRSINRLGSVAVLAIATMAGLLTFTVVTALVFGVWDWKVCGAIGAAAGATAGGFFYVLGLRRGAGTREGRRG